MTDRNDVYKRIIRCIRKMSIDYLNILFCIYANVRDYSSSKACNMSLTKYRRYKKMILCYLEAYRYYLMNKDWLVKKLKKCLTKKQFDVVKMIITMPFVTSKDVASHFGVTPGAVRNMVFHIRKKLFRDDDLKTFGSLLNKFLFFRFNKRRNCE